MLVGDGTANGLVRTPVVRASKHVSERATQKVAHVCMSVHACACVVHTMHHVDNHTNRPLESSCTRYCHSHMYLSKYCWLDVLWL